MGLECSSQSLACVSLTVELQNMFLKFTCPVDVGGINSLTR